MHGEHQDLLNTYIPAIRASEHNTPTVAPIQRPTFPPEKLNDSYQINVTTKSYTSICHSICYIHTLQDHQGIFLILILIRQHPVEAGLYVIEWATLFDSVGLLRGLRFPPTYQKSPSIVW